MLVRLYRLALRLLLPADFAARHGESMLGVFAELDGEARRRGGRAAALAHAARELAGLLRLAGDARRDRRAAPARAIRKRRGVMGDALRQDLRYALRALRRSPGFLSVAVASLALGIGANAAIFSVVRGVLLAPLPFPEPDRIVELRHVERASGVGSALTPGNFDDLRRRATGSFSALAATFSSSAVLSGRGEPRRLEGLSCAGDLFGVLGIEPLIGRALEPSDDAPGAAPVAVLSDRAWRELFGADPAAIGQTLTLDGQAFTVVGVMPPGFAFPGTRIDYWSPSRLRPELRDSRDQYFLRGLGRLRSGVGPAAATAELEAIMARLRQAFPQKNADLTTTAAPLRETLVAEARLWLWLLMGAVGFVLLIACANLGHMMLARAAGRRREIALRQALGARPGRLVRQLLTESLLLGLLGGAAGLALAAVIHPALLALLPEQLPRLHEVRLDAGVVLFAAAVALLSSLGFGLVPALQLAGTSPARALGEGVRATDSRGRGRHALVIAEVALALVLAAGAGLLARSLAAALGVDPGFRSDGLLTFQLQPAGDWDFRDHEPLRFFERVRARLEAVPGVRSVALDSALPGDGSGSSAWINVVGRETPADQMPPWAPYRVVSPGYFETLGIRVLRGRALGASDSLTGTPAVVINERAARRFFPGEDPIGRELVLGPLDLDFMPPSRIVGVVRDVTLEGLDRRRGPAVYVPHAVLPFWRGLSVAVRSDGPPQRLVAGVRAALREVAPDVPMEQVGTMRQLLQGSLAPTRSALLLLSGFAALALLMAALGVFGVLSYTVSQRARELAIRSALGANRASLRGLVLRQGLTQAAAGAILGLVAALALTRLMRSLLFGVEPTDPLTLAAVTALLLAVASLATWLPARRATRVDPMVALRGE